VGVSLVTTAALPGTITRLIAAGKRHWSWMFGRS